VIPGIGERESDRDGDGHEAAHEMIARRRSHFGVPERVVDDRERDDHEPGAERQRLPVA